MARAERPPLLCGGGDTLLHLRPLVARWQRESSGALGDRPRRPRHCPTALQGRLLDIIRGAHRELGWGVRRRYAYLRQAGLIRCSLSSVYRVLRRCGALVRRPRKPKPVWTRYAKENPGERAQMDLKYLPQGRFQLTLVDDCSRFLAATVLERRTTAAVCRALPRLLKTIPFPLRCIQTDNGSEFGRDLTVLLRRLGIRHARIRPRSPHLNGKVERAQRTVQEEFWDGIGPGPLEEWERFLQGYVRFYNRHRQHSAPRLRHAHTVCSTTPAPPGPDCLACLEALQLWQKGDRE